MQGVFCEVFIFGSFTHDPTNIVTAAWKSPLCTRFFYLCGGVSRTHARFTTDTTPTIFIDSPRQCKGVGFFLLTVLRAPCIQAARASSTRMMLAHGVPPCLSVETPQRSAAAGPARQAQTLTKVRGSRAVGTCAVQCPLFSLNRGACCGTKM